MSGYTLTWKPRAQGAAAPADGSVLRPDTLGALALEELARQALRVGRTTVPLGELFDIQGKPGTTLTLRGAPLLDMLGAKMSCGELLIEGDTGDDLGASMRGGLIRVNGSAGQRAGGPTPDRNRGMTGGTILIGGDAGDYPGLRMRGGVVAVTGAAGASPGYRMLAGTIVLCQGPLDLPALEMRRGTLLCLDRYNTLEPGAAFTGAGVYDASALAALRLMLRHLTALGLDQAEPALLGRFRLWSGDRFELHKGELWQWLP